MLSHPCTKYTHPIDLTRCASALHRRGSNRDSRACSGFLLPWLLGIATGITSAQAHHLERGMLHAVCLRQDSSGASSRPSPRDGSNEGVLSLNSLTHKTSLPSKQPEPPSHFHWKNSQVHFLQVGDRIRSYALVKMVFVAAILHDHDDKEMMVRARTG